MILGLDWVSLSFIGSLMMAFSFLLHKKLIKVLGPIWFSALFQFVVAVISIKGVLGVSKISLNIWIIIIIERLFWAVGLVLYAKGLEAINDQGETQIIITSRVLLMQILGLLFLNEQLTIYKVLGALLILGAVLLLFYKGKNYDQKTTSQAGRLMIVVYTLILAGIGTVDTYLMKNFFSGAVQTYLFVSFFITAIFLILYICLRGPKDIAIENNSIKLNEKVKWGVLVILAGLFYNLSMQAVYVAFALGGQYSRVGSIHQTSVIWTVVLGILFFEEKENWQIKTIALLLSMLGVFSLTF